MTPEFEKKMDIARNSVNKLIEAHSKIRRIVPPDQHSMLILQLAAAIQEFGHKACPGLKQANETLTIMVATVIDMLTSAQNFGQN